MPTIQRRTWIAIVIAIVTMVVIAIRSARHDVAGDFARYYEAGKVVAHGEPERLYEDMSILGRFEHSFRYLPIFAIVMAPLSLLSIEAAFCVWQWLHVAGFALCFVASLRMARDGPRPSAWWLLIPFLFSVRLMIGNFQLGQINPIVITLTLTGIWACYRGRDVTGGMLLGAGAAIKFTPAIFLVVLLAVGRYRAFAAQIVFGLVLAAVVPSIVIGPSLHFELLEQYVRAEGDLLGDHDDGERVDGQSLKAIVYRYLTPMNAVHQFKHNDPIYVNVVEADPTLAFALYLTLGISILVLTLLFCRFGDRSSPDRWVLCACLGTLLMVLLSPESRRAHFAILILAFTTFTYRAIVPAIRRRIRILPATLAVLAMLMIAIPSRGLVGRELANWIDAHGNMGFAALLLFAAVFVLDREERTTKFGGDEDEDEDVDAGEGEATHERPSPVS